MHLMIQPDAAGAFVLNPVLRDQGLLSRVIIASVAGTRLYKEPDAKDDAAIRAYGRLCTGLWPGSRCLKPGKRAETAYEC